MQYDSTPHRVSHGLTVAQAKWGRRMTISGHAFFHQATVLICRHLDIEISLAELFTFLQKFIPVKALFLNLFEEDFGAIRTIATANAAGGPGWTDSPI